MAEILTGRMDLLYTVQKTIKNGMIWHGKPKDRVLDVAYYRDKAKAEERLKLEASKNEDPNITFAVQEGIYL